MEKSWNFTRGPQWVSPLFFCVCVSCSVAHSSLSVKMLISLLRNQWLPPSSLLPLSSAIHVSLPMLLDLTQVQAVSQSAVHTHTLHSQVLTVLLFLSRIPSDIIL